MIDEQSVSGESAGHDHPVLMAVKEAFPDVRLQATIFRNQTTLLLSREALHPVMRFLRDDSRCALNFLSDVTAVDYLGYPAKQPGRFAVVYLLASVSLKTRLTVKTYLDPSIDTLGNEDDPELIVDTVTDIWPGAEWREREVYDMFGIRFRGHPDMRRILLWKDFPAFPLRKDYPLRGRGERERYRILERETS
ncbi:MAG: NADH-quinone oxidoreductase subunit C [Phycisphaerales bacterium]|nr:NADH-quinone oxidoreductase subunit C [Phycisphaerales bacterium]